jgi:hypothetical protein
MCGQVNLAAVPICLKLRELLADALNQDGLVRLSLEPILDPKDLGHVHEATLEVGDQAELALLALLDHPEVLIFIVELLLCALNVAAFDQLNAVLPLAKLSEELLLVALELLNLAFLLALGLVKVVGTLNESNQSLKVLEGVLLLEEVGGLDLSEPGNFNHLAEGVLEHLSFLADESLGHIELRLPLPVVLLALLELANVDVSALDGEHGEVLALLIALNHEGLESALALDDIIDLEDLSLALTLLFVHFGNKFS